MLIRSGADHNDDNGNHEGNGNGNGNCDCIGDSNHSTRSV